MKTDMDVYLSLFYTNSTRSFKVVTCDLQLQVRASEFEVHIPTLK